MTLRSLSVFTAWAICAGDYFFKMNKKIGSPCITAVLLTAIAALESAKILPYAPFFLVYGFLAIAASLYYREIYIARLKTPLAQCLRLSLMSTAAGVLYVSVFIAAAGSFLTFNGGMNSFNWDIIFIYRFICQGIALSPVIKNTVLFLFIVGWAGVVEELFYRGVLFGYLRGKRSFIQAALVSSLFFGLRHFLQLLYISPYPAGAGVIYFFFSFTAGMLLSWLYEKTKCLTVCIVTHTAVNLLGFPFLLNSFKN